MSPRTRKLVALYQMLTFGATLVNVGVSVAMAQKIWPTKALAVLYAGSAVLLLFGAASFVAGLWLWRERPAARRASLLIQGLQVPRIALAGTIEYGLALGLSAMLSHGAEPSSMQAPAFISVALGSSADGFYVGINVLALGAFLALLRWRPVAETERAPIPTV
jgi:hypothetical protein